jgi:REP element-mobilizing transposase RayT
MRESTRRKYARYKRDTLHYGGQYRNSRLGRSIPRPFKPRVATHFAHRSSHARGRWSFRLPKNLELISEILSRFSARYGVRISNQCIHFNHFHIAMNVPSRKSYKYFLNSVSAAIALGVTGASRANPLKSSFWDGRPFTRVTTDELNAAVLHDYIEINKLETAGISRKVAKQMVAENKHFEFWKKKGRKR